MKIIYKDGYEPKENDNWLIEKSERVKKYVNKLIELGIVNKNVNVIRGCSDGEVGFYFDAPYGVFKNLDITINDGYCRETVWIEIE